MKRICGERKQSFRNELSRNAALIPQQYYQSKEPVYIVIDDIDQFLVNGKAFEGELHSVMTETAECRVGVITVNSAKLKGIDPLSKWVKAASHGLVLSPQGILNIFPVRSMREYPQMGQGLLFHNGEYVKVQLPECK